MNALQSALSSARFNRLMFWLGAAVLAAGVILLFATITGGSDRTSFNPDKGFKAKLPTRNEPLKNAQGVTIKTFEQLDPEVRTTIRTFLTTAVARKDLGQSWAVVAPSVRKGYTYREWVNATELPIIPYQFDDIDRVQYYLDYAVTNEILVDVGLAARRELKIRPVTFQLGLVLVGEGAKKRWLVDYWMPRWTPPVPADQS